MRIFRWDSAPLAWRLLLAASSGDQRPRTHLALVSPGQEPPKGWTDLLRMTLDGSEGAQATRGGDELVAGNEPPAPQLSRSANT